MMKIKLLKFVCLILAPIALIAMELFHPTGFSSAVYEKLLPHAHWWIQLHLLQPLFFSLVGVGGIILTWKCKGVLSSLSKIFFFLFIVYYTVYDAVAGIGTGVLIDIVKELPASSQPTGMSIIQAYFFQPYLGGTHSWLSEFASFTWLAGIWCAAAVLFLKMRPLEPLLFFFASGPLIWYNHGYPTGPMGFACFLIGALWLYNTTTNFRENSDQELRR